MKSDMTLDCFGLLCPMPIIQTSQKIKEMQEGQILEVLATDEGIDPDIHAWCKATGNVCLGVEKNKDEYRAYVKKV